MTKYSEILYFWLENKGDWFKPKPEFDKILKYKYKNDVDNVSIKNFDEIDDLLGYVVLLDQITRNIYRDTKLAYKNDNIVKEIVIKNINLVEYLSGYNLFLFLLPLQHSEDLDIQEKNIKLWEEIICKEKNKINLNIYKRALKSAKEHYKIILKFKRFPKRNKFLKRENTSEEIEYLKTRNNRFI